MPIRKHARRSPSIARNFLATALAFATLPAFAEQAQDDAGSDSDATKLDQVVVTGQRPDSYTVQDSSAATKLDLSLRETPQSVSVVTRERLDDQDLTSLRDVLDNTNGIYSNQWDTERVLFYSRGFLVDNLMIDGMPVASGTNFNTGAVDETGDTALYDRIEIVHGATGLMSGAGNPGASINLVRKHADNVDPRASLDVDIGSWNDRRIAADASGALNASGSVRGRAVAAYEDTESYQDLYHKKTTVLYGIVDADLSPATRLSLGFDYQDNQPRGNTWGSFPLFLVDGTLADWPRSVTTATDWSFWNRRTETLFGELRHQFGNDWQLRATATWRRYNEDMALFYVYGFPNPGSAICPDPLDLQEDGDFEQPCLSPYAYRSKGEITERALDVYASGPFELFGRRHELVVGYTGSRSTNASREYEPGEMAPVGDFLQWDGSYPEPSFDPDGVPLSDLETRQNGLYAAARFSLADPLTFIAGARHATWSEEGFYLYDTPQESSIDYRKTIPYAGIVFDASREISLFAGYTGIFTPQNARDPDSHPLDPIEGRSLEAGVKGEFLDKRFNAALTVFQTQQDNVATPALDENGDFITFPDGSVASVPTDGTKTRGFEFEAAGRIGEEWELSLGWSRTLIRDGDGQPFRTYIPATMLRTFATWNPARIRGLTLGAGVNWQSASSTIVGYPDGEGSATSTVLRQGDVTLLGLMARYRFNPNVSLQFNGNNLLDEKYYVLDEYDNTYYGAPRSWSMGLHVDF